MNQMKQEESARNLLETEFVDSYGFAETLAALREIAYLKAEHLSADWQDEDGARAWAKAGNRLATAIDYIRAELGSRDQDKPIS